MIVDGSQLIKELRSMKDNYHGAYHPTNCNCPRCYPSKKDILIDRILRKIEEMPEVTSGLLNRQSKHQSINRRLPMSKRYKVFTCDREGEQNYELLKPLCVAVATEFPGLCTAAFAEEVRGRIYPRAEDRDVLDTVLRMAHDGELRYDAHWRVRLP